MLEYMKLLQETCFPMPDRSSESQEVKDIHQELKERLRFGERARLQCLMDKTEALRRLVADDNFAAGFELGWRVRKELQDAGIVPTRAGEKKLKIRRR